MNTISDRSVQAIDLRIDVSSAVSLPGTSMMAASVYLPNPDKLASPPVIIFASPGGGYWRGYFDLRFDNRSGYSQAEYHVAQGLIFVAYDHLGVGDSTTEHNQILTVEMIAAADHAMVTEILARLARGSIQPDFPAVDEPFVIGIGQSMGAGVTIVMQGRHRTFDAVGILGVSAIHTQLPQATLEASRRSRVNFMFTRATPNKELSIRRLRRQHRGFQVPLSLGGCAARHPRCGHAGWLSDTEDHAVLRQRLHTNIHGGDELPRLLHAGSVDDRCPGLHRRRRARCLPQSLGGAFGLLEQQRRLAVRGTADGPHAQLRIDAAAAVAAAGPMERDRFG